MFVLRPDIGSRRQLRLLQSQRFVPPFAKSSASLLLLLLLVVSACQTITASPLTGIHKSQSTTPMTSQLSTQRIRRNALALERDVNGQVELEPLEFSGFQQGNPGLENLRRYLSSECIQYSLGRTPSFNGDVLKTLPCKHPTKYLDGQWEDMLYAEEPGYVVVRREVEPEAAEPNNAGGEPMDFVPIRGRKSELSARAGWQSALNSGEVAEDVAPGRTSQLPSKRESRPSIRNTLWPTATAKLSAVAVDDISGRGKKGRIDQILSKEDFLPNRGKKRLFQHLSYILSRPQRTPSSHFPKRGKKTRHLPKNVNSRPVDLMWLTKDDFFPHRGKRFDNSNRRGEVVGYLEQAPADYDDHDPAEEQLEEDVPASLADGVILSRNGRRLRRDLVSPGQNRELLSNLSKQEPSDKWRGRHRSAMADTESDATVAAAATAAAPLVLALNENNAGDAAPSLFSEDHVNAAADGSVAA